MQQCAPDEQAFMDYIGAGCPDEYVDEHGEPISCHRFLARYYNNTATLPEGYCRKIANRLDYKPAPGHSGITYSMTAKVLNIEKLSGSSFARAYLVVCYEEGSEPGFWWEYGDDK